MPRARSSEAGKRAAPAARATSSARSTARERSSEPPGSPPEPPRQAETTQPDGSGPLVSLDASVVKGLARSASRIVSQATSILEEELANGIGAAKQIESRLLNVAEMRSTNSAEVMARFRKDAHEVVDIVIDLLNVPTRSLGGLADRVSIGEDASESRTGSSSQTPMISIPGEVPPGGSAKVPFSLENDGDTPTAEFAFQATDLVSADGETIPASNVTFEPATLTIPAHDRESVTIGVSVPKAAAPGVYTGLVLASKLERLRAVVVVSVG